MGRITRYIAAQDKTCNVPVTIIKADYLSGKCYTPGHFTPWGMALYTLGTYQL